jgi:hypothetical protein
MPEKKKLEKSFTYFEGKKFNIFFEAAMTDLQGPGEASCPSVRTATS